MDDHKKRWKMDGDSMEVGAAGLGASSASNTTARAAGSSDETARAKAHLDRLQTQLEQVNDVLFTLGQEILAAIKSGNSELEAKLVKEREKAEQQIKDLKSEIEAIRREVGKRRTGSDDDGDKPALNPVNEKLPGIGTFISRQLKAELTAPPSEEGTIQKKLRLDTSEPAEQDRYLKLVSELEGIHNGRKIIYVRDAMKSIVHRAIAYLEDDPDRWLVLGGTRGCGKSVVGSLVAILLAQKGHVVLYQQRGETMLILTERVAASVKSDLDEIIKEAKIPPIPLSTNVWELDENVHGKFIKLFVRVRNFIFIQDLGDQKNPIIPTENGSGKRLIVSSPNAEKLELIRKNNRAELLIMPTWTLYELQQLEAKDPLSVKDRFERVGGIPRWVIDQKSGETEKMQDKQIDGLSANALQIVFGGAGYLDLPSQVDKTDRGRSTDLIFRIEPKEGSNNTEATVVLTSEYVTKRLAERYVSGSEDQILQFASVIQKTDRLSELRARTLEGAVHRAFKPGTDLFKTMSVLVLKEKADPQMLMSNIPTMTFHSVQEFTEVKDLKPEELQSGCYFHAKRKNEETIDSFAIVDEAFVRKYFPHARALSEDFGRRFKAEEKRFIVFFQVTIADEHVVDGTVLRRLQEQARQVLGIPKLPMVYCFISWPKGIVRPQTVTHKETSTKADATGAATGATAATTTTAITSTRKSPKRVTGAAAAAATPATTSTASTSKGSKRVPFVDQAQFGQQYLIHLRGKFDEIAELLRN